MLELARLFRARELRKTLVLVSTSGATDGFTGARAWAERRRRRRRRRRARARRPGRRARRAGRGSCRGRSARAGAARRSSARSRTRCAPRPGGRAATPRHGQWIRRALPFTVSEQGVIADASLPAVLIGASGERGPAAGEPRAARRGCSRFGRAALRAVMRDRRRRTPARTSARRRSPAARTGIVTMRNVLPDWAVRLLVGTLLLPALLTALDGFFRVRRRRLAVAPVAGVAGR